MDFILVIMSAAILTIFKIAFHVESHFLQQWSLFWRSLVKKTKQNCVTPRLRRDPDTRMRAP